MPNIISQAVNSTGLTVEASNHNVWTVTTAAILARFILEIGTIVQRRLKTRAFFKQQCVDTLGPELIELELMDMDFIEATGVPTTLEFRSAA